MQKSVQKKHHNRRHNTRDLPELHPGQPVLFLSPADANSYNESTITGPSTTPHSYMIETQGRTYCQNRHHIHPIHTDTTPFSKPSTHQSNPFPGPSEQDPPFQNTPVTKIAPLQNHIEEQYHKLPILLKKTLLNTHNKAAYPP